MVKISMFSTHNITIKSLAIFLGFIFISPVFAEDAAKSPSEKETVVEKKVEKLSSKKIVIQAWEASAKREKEKLEGIIAQCVDGFGEEAKKQQASLKELPARDVADQYQSLNDVGTCMFIYSEFLMNSGKSKEAIESFEKTKKEYGFAQAWDASRGGFWSIAEKSQASLDVLTGKAQEELDNRVIKKNRTKPQLKTKGTANIVDYTKYGEFLNVGEPNYHYRMKDPDGLAKALGEGIYPNIRDIYQNPRYKELKKEGRLDGSYWDYVNTDDLEAAYFKWVMAKEPRGVRLFYTALVFEKAGMFHEALKAYHALIVHFPKTTAYTYWQTPWYPAQAAVAKIRHILRTHPELKLEDKWMNVKMENGFDNETENDIFYTYPGRIVPVGVVDKLKNMFHLEDNNPLGTVKRKVGEGNIHLVEYENGHWQLMVDGSPYIIKAVTYTATKVGQSPDKGTLANWMEEDSNENGKIDGPYDSWVDKNRNNKQDPDEPVVGDFQLLKEMGANTIRVYHVPDTPNKELLRDLYHNYGIRVIMGDFLGKYAIGSGATWSEGTDYENEEHLKNMMESVKKMVMEHKDEPYVLLWLLGNENNYGVACNADKKPEAYFKFVNEVATWIKSVDKKHPVAVNNGDTLFLDIFAKYAPNVDIFTANVYRGDYGFGAFWEQVLEASGKPALITEYGAPAYAPHLELEEAEIAQADYHKGNWMDIQENTAGQPRGVGNSLGGVIFEWMDEWWKNYEPYLHDRKSDTIGPFPGGYYFEEWFGIVGQGKGKHSPFLRHLRKSYFTYKELWTEK